MYHEIMAKYDDKRTYAKNILGYVEADILSLQGCPVTRTALSMTLEPGRRRHGLKT